MPWHVEDEGRGAVAHILADTCAFQGVCHLVWFRLVILVPSDNRFLHKYCEDLNV